MRSGGLLVQGSAGQRGNFEVVVPRAGGGFWHFWRDNDLPTHPWHGPDMAMGSEGDVSAVAVIEDNLRPGELASLRRTTRPGYQRRRAPAGCVAVIGHNVYCVPDEVPILDRQNVALERADDRRVC